MGTGTPVLFKVANPFIVIVCSIDREVDTSLPLICFLAVNPAAKVYDASITQHLRVTHDGA